MQRDPANLANETFDVVVIGGGVYGLATSWACALRGLRTAVVERHDFGAATSSGSLKLIHGGLRYLQHLDLVRMRISIGERRHMLRMAPHLVFPLPFLIPCYGHGMRGPEALRLAMAANDIISADRNRTLPDASKHIPNGRSVSPEVCAQLLPGVRREGLRGAGIFYDAQMHSAERLTLAFGLAASDAGAVLANYTEAMSFERAGFAADDSAPLAAVRVRDHLTGEEYAVRGNTFINMTGPWCDILLHRLRGPEPGRIVRRSKGIQLIVRDLNCPMAFAAESRQRDKTAVIARGGRSFFSTPWRGAHIIGTTDALFEGDPDSYGITEEDIARFLAEFNEAYPAAALMRADVKSWCGGLRPLGDVDADPDHCKASHQYDFIDHAHRGGPHNLITVVGVKYTICRTLAERAAALAEKKCGRTPLRAEPTATARLAGGDLDDFPSFEREQTALADGDTVLGAHLARNYGTRAKEIWGLARATPEWRERITGAPEVIRAEIVHAVREECAVHLGDAVFRRTDLGSLGHPGRAALEEAAALMADELKWSPDRVAAELAQTERAFSAQAR